MPVLKLRRPNGEIQDIALTTNRSLCGTWALPVFFNGTQYWARLHTDNRSSGKVRRPDGTVLTLQPLIATSGSWSTRSENAEGWITGLAPNTAYNFTIDYYNGNVRTTRQTTDNNGAIHYKLVSEKENIDNVPYKKVTLGSYAELISKKLNSGVTISWTPV